MEFSILGSPTFLVTTSKRGEISCLPHNTLAVLKGPLCSGVIFKKVWSVFLRKGTLWVMESKGLQGVQKERKDKEKTNTWSSV